MSNEEEWCDYSDMPKSICRPHCTEPDSKPYPATPVEQANLERKDMYDKQTVVNAKFSSVCMSSDCGEMIDIGDPIVAMSPFGWRHEECPDV